MASTYLTRTPSSNGSQRIMTFSAWIKLGITTSNAFFSTGSSGSALFSLYFTNSSKLQMEYYNGSTNYYLRTNRLFRDVNAWYHIVMVLDTTQATASNRMKIYVNGTEETSFDASQYPTQNFDVQYINSTSYSNKVGNNNGANFFNGSMSHVHFIDGTAYTPSAFGSTDSTTGEWKINTSPSVTYGTNGFFILKDGNSGTDQSGNSNNFTVGAGTLTKTEDCPSNVFATLNPLFKTQGTETYASGNNTYKCDNNSYGTSVSTIAPNSGKWYFEIQSTFDDGTKGFMGFMDIDNSFLTSSHKYLGMSGTGNCGMGYYGGGTIVGNGNSNLHTGLHDWDNGDVIGCALDIDNNKAYFHVNGTYLTISSYVQNPSSGQYGIDTSSSLYGGAVGFGVSSKDNYNIYANFGNGSFHSTQLTGTTYQYSNGQGIFKYQPPTNFLALCTKNLNE